MITKWTIPEGERVVAVFIREGEDVADAELREQHLAYEVVIQTDKREVVLAGCHDSPADYVAETEPPDKEMGIVK